MSQPLAFQIPMLDLSPSDFDYWLIQLRLHDWLQLWRRLCRLRAPLYTGTTEGNKYEGVWEPTFPLIEVKCLLSLVQVCASCGYTSPGNASDMPVCLHLGSTSDLFRRYASFGSLRLTKSHLPKSASENPSSLYLRKGLILLLSILPCLRRWHSPLHLSNFAQVYMIRSEHIARL